MKNELQSNKPVFGFERTLKNLKNRKTKIVFFAHNCPSEFKERISLYDVDAYELTVDGTELSLICKRPHRVSIISF